MSEVKAVEKKRTLMDAYHSLEQKYCELREVAEMVVTVNQKLNRTEGEGVKTSDLLKDKEEMPIFNIIELFDNLTNSIKEQIDIIGRSSQSSMSMID